MNPTLCIAHMALKMEVAATLGPCMVVLLCDFAAFYDTISLSALLQEQAVQHSSGEAAALAAQMHVGLRLLAIGEALAAPVLGTGRFIVAGCASSASFARGLLDAPVNEPLQSSTGTPHSTSKQHVEDVSQLDAESSEQTALEETIRLGGPLPEQRCTL